MRKGSFSRGLECYVRNHQCDCLASQTVLHAGEALFQCDLAATISKLSGLN